MNVKLQKLSVGAMFFAGAFLASAQTTSDTARVAEIEEVVVTGYGTVKREEFVGTSAKVDSEVLSRKNVSSATQALAGEVAGVRIITTSGQPGSAATIRVRGFGSVNGSRDPLIVLDGVPYSGSLASINPEDIESQSVLKDATATAIYGARGANGVVVITTKSGKRGGSEVMIETKTGVNANLLPRYDVIKSPDEYIALAWQSMLNHGKITGVADPVSYANSRLFGAGSSISQAYNMWNVADGGALIDPATGKVRNGVTRRYNPENWEDYGFRTGTRQETNLSISGGADKTRYYSNFGYLKDEGFLINTNYERYSGRLNVSHQAKSWLSGSVNLGYAYSKTKNGGQSSDSGSVFWFVDNLPSIYPLFLRDAAGNIVQDPFYGANRYDYGDEVGYSRGFGNGTNAIADALYSKSDTRRHNVNGSASLKADIFPFLSFETRIGGSFDTRVYDSVGSKYYGSSKPKGSIYKYDYDTFNYTFLQMLKFNKRYGSHGISAFAAHETQDFKYNVMYAGKNDLVIDGGNELNNASNNLGSWSYMLNYTMESYFGNLAYDYDGKYLLTGNIRRDGSSRFILPENKWGTFWSVGAGWVISREDFMKNNDFFRTLKLKASYGVIGDQAGVGYYPGFNTYTVFPLNGEISTPYQNVGYPLLTWEQSKIFQTGVEFALFKNRIFEGSVDFYSKTTDNLIFDKRVPPSLGYAIVKVNDGGLLNQGVEFTLNTNFIRNQNAHLSLNINGEVLRNELLEMPIDSGTGLPKNIDVQGLYGWAKGKSIYDFYIREWAGVNSANGRGQWVMHYVDVNKDGKFDTGDTRIASLADFQANNPDAAISSEITENWNDATLKYVGKSAIPKVRGGFTLNSGYKGFSLSTQFLYSIGGYSYDGAYANLMRNDQIGGSNWHKDMLNSWTDTNTNTDIPRLSNGYTFSQTVNGVTTSINDTQFNGTSTRFLTKADYLVLNNVRLGYDLSRDVVESFGMTGLTLFVTGDNLWLSTKRRGFNPSTAESGSSDMYRYSPVSTVTFGVRAKF